MDAIDVVKLIAKIVANPAALIALVVAIWALLKTCLDDDSDEVKNIRKEILESISNNITNNFGGYNFYNSPLYKEILKAAKRAAKVSPPNEETIIVKRNGSFAGGGAGSGGGGGAGGGAGGGGGRGRINLERHDHHITQKVVNIVNKTISATYINREDVHVTQKTVNQVFNERHNVQIEQPQFVTIDLSRIAAMERRIAELEARLA